MPLIHTDIADVTRKNRNNTRYFRPIRNNPESAIKREKKETSERKKEQVKVITPTHLLTCSTKYLS